MSQFLLDERTIFKILHHIHYLKSCIFVYLYYKCIYIFTQMQAAFGSCWRPASPFGIPLGIPMPMLILVPHPGKLLVRSFMAHLPHNKIYTHREREPSTRRCTQWGCPLCPWSFAPDRAISTRSPVSSPLDNRICSIMNLSRKCILPKPSERQGLFGR